MDDFKAVTASCVFVGSLNPAIITPEWVVKNKVLLGGESQIQLAMGSMGPISMGPVSPIFSLSGISWTANYSRLTVTRDAAEADPGEFAARVAETLEHTPINGVGNNFQYEPSEGRSGALAKVLQSVFMRDLPQPPYAFLAQEVTLQLASGSDAVVTVACRAEASVVIVRFNFHRECSSAGEAAKAARNFLKDEQEALSLTRRLMNLAKRKRSTQ